MGKKGAVLFQPVIDGNANEDTWNIVELESRRQLRRAVHTLIELSNSPLVTTSEIRAQLDRYTETFGSLVARQLIRLLHSDDEQTRQSVVWLLTLVEDEAAIALLWQMSQDRRLTRGVRLSAALALAGKGATLETTPEPRRKRLYAVR
jgi:HEAT repeat protein